LPPSLWCLTRILLPGLVRRELDGHEIALISVRRGQADDGGEGSAGTNGEASKVSVSSLSVGRRAGRVRGRRPRLAKAAEASVGPDGSARAVPVVGVEVRAGPVGLPVSDPSSWSLRSRSRTPR
jgi:hypothetical protein